ncbi:RipA family octameric membrane protein [Enterobacter hormaechei]|uniref:RipA family octameric membrane protein n=1 Tax=Enterobacteriaceae TaxID=543 RepID=UPI0006DA360C
MIHEHAWKYFEVHSQQRITVFNFYITIISLLVAGGGICLQQGSKLIYFTSVFGLFIMFITFIFYKLDTRVSLLIKNAERALRKTEEQFDKKEMKIFTLDHDNKNLNESILSPWSYGKCFRISFSIISYIGFMLTLSPMIIKLIE